MPGRIFLERPMDAVIQASGLPGPLSGPVPHVPARVNIAPGTDVLAHDGTNWGMMRWGMIPVGRTNARGRPVMETIVNARSETVFDKSAFQGVGRAVVPADGWYEWTGAARKKTPWSITRKDGGMLFFAAIFDIWQAPGGLRVPQVATVTCAPNADVRDIHHRMGVILNPSDFPVWLGDDTQAAAALMQPMADGLLDVRKADPARVADPARAANPAGVSGD